MQPQTIAIIGAGFSGALVAIHLAHARAQHPLTIYLIDRRGTFGPGLAYSPPSTTFKLNVRAKAMGAFPDDPEGFLRWLKEREPLASGDDFISRGRYGEYLSHLVEHAASSPQSNRLVRVHNEVTGLIRDPRSGTFTLQLKDGAPLSADRCVVAIGNLMKRSLSRNEPTDIFRSPFDSESYSDLRHLKSLTIIGTGLTAVDVILESENRGFKGHYSVISRHGHLPLPHEPHAPRMDTPLPARWESSGSVSTLLKLVRERSRPLASSQPVIDAMRPLLQEVWRNLSVAERSRFLRHVRPLWEIHRHRIPTEHSRSVQRLRDEGRLTLIAGRVTSTVRDKDRIALHVAPRGKDTSPLALQSEAVFLCAGTEGDLSQVQDPLIQDLLRQGLVTAGPLRLGAAEPAESPSSSTRTAFWILGPIQRETLWEITAVRELREEALSIARQVLTSLIKD
jgi:uncharacterized NAD(P)/FAD-binding protein YdhS